MAILVQLRQLHSDLTALVERDPDQEVRGIAEPVLDIVIADARRNLPDKVPLRQMAEVISVYRLEHDDEPMRAADALLAVGPLLAEYQAIDTARWIAANRALRARPLRARRPSWATNR